MTGSFLGCRNHQQATAPVPPVLLPRHTGSVARLQRSTVSCRRCRQMHAPPSLSFSLALSSQQSGPSQKLGLGSRASRDGTVWILPSFFMTRSQVSRLLRPASRFDGTSLRSRMVMPRAAACRSVQPDEICSKVPPAHRAVTRVGTDPPASGWTNQYHDLW